MDKKKILEDVEHKEEIKEEKGLEIKTRIRREKWRPKEVFE